MFFTHGADGVRQPTERMRPPVLEFSATFREKKEEKANSALREREF